MKKFPFADLVFFALAALILIVLTELGYEFLITRYAFILIISAYFVGKLVQAKAIKR